MQNIFSELDVNDLMNNPSDDTKISIINKLAKNYDFDSFSDEEKEVANEVLKLLAKDISARIRINISEKFCRNNNIPQEVAVQLANDIEDFVAIPMVQFSGVLKDEDLENIINTDQGEKQRAIARRENISEGLQNTIITKGSERTIEALIANEDVELTKEQCQSILDTRKHSEAILSSLVENDRLSVEDTHDLIANASEKLKNMIVLKYDLPANTVNNLVHESKEWMTVGMIRSHMEGNIKLLLPEIVNKLARENELSINILIEGLGIGNVEFFEAAMAKLADIPAENVNLLIKDGGQAGLEALFNKCRMPIKMLPAIMTLHKIVVRELANQNSKENLENRIVKRTKEYRDYSEVEHMSHLVTILTMNNRI